MVQDLHNFSGGSAVSEPVLARAAERINVAMVEEGEQSHCRPEKRKSMEGVMEVETVRRSIRMRTLVF